MANLVHYHYLTISHAEYTDIVASLLVNSVNLEREKKDSPLAARLTALAGKIMSATSTPATLNNPNNQPPATGD